VNALAGNIAQRLVDHALAIDPALSSKRICRDLNGKMRFARAVMAMMAGMMMAIIDDHQVLRRKCSQQQGFDFGRDRPFGVVVHDAGLA
jgi:hypothetical protein